MTESADAIDAIKAELDALSSALDDLAELRRSIREAKERRESETQAVYDRIVTPDVQAELDEIDRRNATDSEERTALKLECSLREAVLRLQAPIAGKHLKILFISASETVSARDVKAFSRMLPPPYQAQALSLIQVGLASTRLVDLK